MTTISRGNGLDYPWSITNRQLQLAWWDRYGQETLRRIGPVKVELETVIVSRPPDDMRFVGEEKSASEHTERRHTTFKTWPVKVIVTTVRDLLGLYWELPDGRKIGLRIAVNERTYTHEEDVAGA